MNKEFKIILKNDLSTSEEELVKTYWDFVKIFKISTIYLSN